jgi:ABC-type transporter Mla maintaining outer membrane lipid asymmetry ATPase subunit MlaF
MDSVITLEDVGLTIEDATILEGVNAEVPRNATTFIMGPSGSGKSMLLKCAAGIIPCDTGKVRFEGKALARMREKEVREMRQNHGFVFQDAALWQNITVYQNLALPLQYHHPELSETEVRRRIQALVDLTRFSEDLSLRPASLSLGERKIASFIRALVLNPDVIFMDEPSTSLDAEAVERISEVIQRLKQEERTMLISSHNARLASRFADYVIVIDRGRVLAFDSMENIVKTESQRVRRILAEVLNISSSYDTDILELLGDDNQDPFAF